MTTLELVTGEDEEGHPDAHTRAAHNERLDERIDVRSISTFDRDYLQRALCAPPHVRTVVKPPARANEARRIVLALAWEEAQNR